MNCSLPTNIFAIVCRSRATPVVVGLTIGISLGCAIYAIIEDERRARRTIEPEYTWW